MTTATTKRRTKTYRQGRTYKTRFDGLSFENRGDHWRVIDESTGCGVGPFYATRDELLNNIGDFAASRGFA